MTKSLFRLPALLAFVGLLAGCEAYELDSINPIDSVPGDQAITDLTSAKAARAGVYHKLQDADLAFDGFLSLPLYFSDDCDFTGTFPTRAQFDNYNVLPSNGTMGRAWEEFYDVINTANNFVQIVGNVNDPTLNDAARNSLIAEARFGRALAYFNLVQGWQDIPLILTPTVSVGEALNVPKTAAAQIFDQIIDDAEFTAGNINEGESLGINVAAAKALLARVALIQGRYSDAQALATEAIGEDYDLTADAYLTDEIFYLKFSPTDGNSNAFFFGPSDLNGRYSIAPSATLVAAYEEGDLRKAVSVDTLGGLNYGKKYDDFAAAGGSQSDPLYLFRKAEQVLIIAECAARASDFETANRWFNQVRSRAGLSELTLDASNFEELILQERFVELAMEGGFRLWDLRRTGRALDVLGPDGYEACDNVWPLPQQNIDTNTALEQNACCNC